MEGIKNGVYAELSDGRLVSVRDFKPEMKDYAVSIVVKWGLSCVRMALHNPEGEYNFEDAQDAAARLGVGWRCPTRHQWIDVFDARFNGLDELLRKLDAEPINSWYWTCEEDANPQYSAQYAWSLLGAGLVTSYNKRYGLRVCAVSDFQI